MMKARTAMTKTFSMPRCEAANEDTADVESLRGDLVAVLGQLFELHVQSVEAHAHFVGTQFIGFQRQLEAVVHTARKASGAVAEVLRGLDGDAPRSLTIAGVRPGLPGLRPGERCSTAAVNMITHRISLVLDTIRCTRHQLADSDIPNADLLGAIADAVEEQARMLAAESRWVSSTADPDAPSIAEWIDPPASLGSRR